MSNNVTQPIVIDWIIELLKSKAHKGLVKINGEYKRFDIYKTYRDGDKVRFLLYVTSDVGLVEEAQLVSSTGEVWALKPYSINKQDDGLVLAFEFDITIMESGDGNGV